MLTPDDVIRAGDDNATLDDKLASDLHTLREGLAEKRREDGRGHIGTYRLAVMFDTEEGARQAHETLSRATVALFGLIGNHGMVVADIEEFETSYFHVDGRRLAALCHPVHCLRREDRELLREAMERQTLGLLRGLNDA